MKKTLSLILSIIFVLSIVGCDSKTTSKDDDMLEIELMVNNESKNNDDNQYYIKQVFKDKFNINLKLTQNSTITGHMERLKLLTASNELPDIISPLPEDEAKKIGVRGSLLAIDEYMDIMPNFEKYIKMDKKAYLSLLASDAHLYSLPKISEPMTFKWSPMIRVDMVKDVGKEIPTTMTELIDTLVAIKEKYPNTTGIINSDKMNFIQAYGVFYNTYTGMFYDVTQDKWTYAPLNEGYKELVYDFNKINNLGLLDKEFFTASSAQKDEKLLNDMGVFLLDWPNVVHRVKTSYKALHPDDSKFNLNFILPLRTNSYNKTRINKSQTVGSYTSYGVSSKIKSPERVLKAIDYLYSDEGANLLQWGVEGKEYEIVDGQKKYLPHVMVTYNKDGNTNLSEVIGVNATQIMRVVKEDGFLAVSQEEKDIQKFYVEKGVEIFENFYKIQLTFTKEEEDRIRAITNDLSTYTSETTINLITGNAPLSDYTKFTDRMRSAGADELEKIYAEAYKRFQTLLAQEN